MPKPAGIIPSAKWVAFACFVLSGAASVSYELIWLREAMTYFGVINPVVSSVLSVFMMGLALGTWLAGKFTRHVRPADSVKYYAAIELLVGLYALMVPALFKAGYGILLGIGAEQSGQYLLWSWAIITIILLPVCTLIGCTFPVLMHYLRAFKGDKQNFGFLYYANLLGGVLGCILPLAAIEAYGFSKSLCITAALNIMAFLLAMAAFTRLRPDEDAEAIVPAPTAKARIPLFPAMMLFFFGFTTLGSEVLWIRAFIPAVGPTVYSFAKILAVYLIFSALGTGFYLAASRNRTVRADIIMQLLPACALLPILTSNTNLLYHLQAGTAGIGAISFCLGFLTPRIIDDISGNDAHKASVAYLYNFAGCITGPLFSTYIMFFYTGLKGTLVFYAAILFVISLMALNAEKMKQAITAVLFLGLLFPVWHFENVEDYIARNGRLERDYVGYIGATGQGMDKTLIVNGIGMTVMTTITKLMADLPMLERPKAKSALVICFGMGTTTRTLTTWPLERIRVAELSKGVTRLFGYFHSNAAEILGDARVQIVVDDGRRYLNRAHEQFDIITIDPPPPITSSGSGLLYTTDFLKILKKRLTPTGVLAHWIYPWIYTTEKDKVFLNASINAIKSQFKYVRIYDSITPGVGLHVLASDSPLPQLSAQDFINGLPARAAADLKEWEGQSTLQQLAERSVHEIKEDAVLSPELGAVTMSDDRLYNEFYLLRYMGLIKPSSDAAVPTGN